VTTVGAVLGTDRQALDLAGTLPQLEAVVAVARPCGRGRSASLTSGRRCAVNASGSRAGCSASPCSRLAVVGKRARDLGARAVRAGRTPCAAEQFELRLRDARVLRVDFAWPACWLIVEIDGYEFHHGREVFVHDRRRQNALVLAGWTVLRFTPDDLRSQPEALVAQV